MRADQYGYLLTEDLITVGGGARLKDFISDGVMYRGFSRLDSAFLV